MLIHDGIFDKINVFSLFIYDPSTPSETSKSGYKFKEDSNALQRYKIIKSRK